MATITRTPKELDDALARIEMSKRDFQSLRNELEEFLYDYIRGMIRNEKPEDGAFTLRFRRFEDSLVKGVKSVFVAQIVENLRTSLDYMVFELSKKNDPNLNERVPQFPILNSNKNFGRQVKKSLRYLSNEQLNFIDDVQPYKQDNILRILGEMTRPTKHRHLIYLRDNTSFHIYLSEITRKDEYEGYFFYPLAEGAAFFAKPMGEPSFVLLDQYDALPLLESMIVGVSRIVYASSRFFQT